jgi:hypothetical protein
VGMMRPGPVDREPGLDAVGQLSLSGSPAGRRIGRVTGRHPCKVDVKLADARLRGGDELGGPGRLQAGQSPRLKLGRELSFPVDAPPGQHDQAAQQADHDNANNHADDDDARHDPRGDGRCSGSLGSGGQVAR